MKTSIYWYLGVFAIVAIFQQCKSQDKQKGFNSPILPQVDSLLATFSEGINKKDSTAVFVVLKNVDANTLKIYLVAKKPVRSDFEFIGLPIASNKKNDINFYFFTGMEKIFLPDTTFWKNHPEIFDDRLKQARGLYETPIVKKELYLFEDGQIKKQPTFDDMIFVDSPVDTIRFH
jgi:hypothetical protein